MNGTNYKRLKDRFKLFGEKYNFVRDYYNESIDVYHREYYIPSESIIKFSLTKFKEIYYFLTKR